MSPYAIMMGLLNLNFRAFCHATEDETKVIQAVKFVSGSDDVSREVTEGYHGNKIIIFEMTIKEKRRIRDFMTRLEPRHIQELMDTLDRRMDEDCNIYMRFDKQEASLGNLILTTGDDPIAVRAKVESYPKNRDTAMKGAMEYFESLLQANKG